MVTRGEIRARKSGRGAPGVALEWWNVGLAMPTHSSRFCGPDLPPFSEVDLGRWNGLSERERAKKGQKTRLSRPWLVRTRPLPPPPKEAEREGFSPPLAPSPWGESWGEGWIAATPSRKSNDPRREAMASVRAVVPPKTSSLSLGQSSRRHRDPTIIRTERRVKPCGLGVPW